MEAGVKLSLWQKSGKRRIYINHSAYRGIKIFLDAETGPCVRADWPLDSQTRNLILEKCEEYFLQADIMLKGDRVCIA